MSRSSPQGTADRAIGMQHQTSFLPANFAVHPLPDQPIRAGLPQLVPEMVMGGPGDPTRLRVRWPSGLTGVHLERAESLESPIQWLRAGGTEVNQAEFELPDADQPGPADGTGRGQDRETQWVILVPGSRDFRWLHDRTRCYGENGPQ